MTRQWSLSALQMLPLALQILLLALPMLLLVLQLLLWALQIRQPCLQGLGVSDPPTSVAR